tara:strand:- start:403 stop:717 length:315 start_codon:yes stop_codon:yes gene_type:complete
MLYFLYHLVFQVGREALIRPPAAKEQLRRISPYHHLTGTDKKHFLSTRTTGFRVFHFYNRTGGTFYGPEARNIHGFDESVYIKSIRQTLNTYFLFSRWCEITPV